jgi:tripartite-type tricarboxylate transporter receptor subunit TctC
MAPRTALRTALGTALAIVSSVTILALSVPSPAQAQGGATAGYPNKPVRVIIPYPPGGSGELFARPIAKRLTDVWGQNVLLDFKPGAGGTIASELLVQAAPDGYTLMVVLAAHAINPSLYPRLAYDTLKDFAPVTMAATLPLILETHPDVPAKNVAELIDYARRNPKALNFASAGNGNTSHLTGELFKSAAKIQMQHVPYKGSGPAVVALVGGEVQLMFDSLSSSLSQIQAGKLRPLAVASARRSPVLPDIPTISESGLPGFVVEPWYGFLAPAATPKALVAKISKDINDTLSHPETRAALEKLGYEPRGTTPEGFDTHIRSELKQWTAVVKESGAKID